MQVCTSLQTDNHASTSPLSFFTGRMLFLPPNQQRQSTEGSGKTSLDLIEARDNRAWESGGISWTISNNLHLAPDRQPHQYLITQFLQAGCSF